MIILHCSLQKITYLYLTTEVTQQLIIKAKHDYKQRLQALSAALTAEDIAFTPATDGLNIWINLPAHNETEKVMYSLAKHGWLVRSGKSFQVDKNLEAIRITLSKLEEKQMTLLAQHIKQSIKAKP